MHNKNTLLLSLSLLALAATTAPAAFYADLRASHLALQDTPDIGDIGAKTGSDLSPLSLTFAVGYELSPRVDLQLRYTHLGNITINKVSPYATVFPLKPGEVSATVVTNYIFKQRTNLFSLALPFQIWEKEKLSLRLTPLLQLETAKVELGFGGTMLPYVSSVPVGTVFHRRSTTELHAAGEIALGCRLSESARAYLHYTYAPLSNFDAHLFGTGLELKF